MMNRCFLHQMQYITVLFRTVCGTNFPSFHSMWNYPVHKYRSHKRTYTDLITKYEQCHSMCSSCRNRYSNNKLGTGGIYAFRTLGTTSNPPLWREKYIYKPGLYAPTSVFFYTERACVCIFN